MMFIEVRVDDDHALLEPLVREAHRTTGFPEVLPNFRFGRVIVWQGRMFQQLETSPEAEDWIFRLCTLPAGRAKVQVGSIRGEVFTTPPEVEGEPAARIKEGGRCGREYMVRPFHYSDDGH
jgi:hypothetical protein